ncbi:MAG: hypothetical protein GF400_03185, partial [Candidatus Eisenbacteria bacterium]|nr:hypothetical protein [Candidatus Eisenbacteria bacterium]
MASRWLCLALALATAGFSGASRAAESESFVGVDEIRPGDRCVARSVFSGTTVEEFEMEILGIVRGSAPGRDLIIARAEGERVERTGIAQGMSGSPVYREGRLLGAISATWPFSREPIAGITPIGEMLPAIESPAGTEDGSSRGALGLMLIPEDERERSRMAGVSRLAGVESAGLDHATSGAVGAYAGRPLSAMPLPLVVSGAGTSVPDAAAALLSELGFAPVQGISAGGEGKAGELVPGSSVGVRFVGGDMNWTAVGTLTHVEDGRVLAFGHPVFGAGAVELPLVGAHVHAVLPLVSVSFKYASGT